MNSIPLMLFLAGLYLGAMSGERDSTTAVGTAFRFFRGFRAFARAAAVLVSDVTLPPRLPMEAM